MTPISIVLLIAAIIASCSSSAGDDAARADVVGWASQVAAIEARLQLEINRAEPLIATITSHPPTASELSQLSDYGNRITSLYNEMAAITPPREARHAQDLYLQNYSLIAESARYYVLAVETNNVAYFNRSAEAASKANEAGSQAYYAFQDLMDQYRIACTEIDYCE